MDFEYLDQSDIFTLLYNGNVSAAKQLFCQRFELYKKDFSLQNFREFLCAFNYGIYYYILFHENTSLDACCCRNHDAIRASQSTPDALCKTGVDLIHNYGYCTDYLVSCYKNKHIRHALRHIHQNLSECICLVQLAKHVGLSKNQLCFLFKEDTGRTISRYITERRITTAKGLLQKGGQSIELIAELCGFSSAAYFCTVFKRETGQTPLQYSRDK